MKKFYIGLCIILLSLSAEKANATHAMGADLTYDYLGNNTYRIMLKFYRDCSGIPAPPAPYVTVSSATCGITTYLNLNLVSVTEISQLCASAVSTCRGGTFFGAEQYIYTGIISLQQCTDWVFEFDECCRNTSITNSILPDNYTLHIRATLNNVLAPTNSSPDFTTIPTPFICLNQPFTYNHGVTDPNGNTIVYSLAHPVGINSGITPVSVPYSPGFDSTYPISTSSGTVTFNSSSGQLSMTPNAIQIGIVTVLVQEYNSAGQLIGSVERDMEVIVYDCALNDVPVISNPSSVNFCLI